MEPVVTAFFDPATFTISYIVADAEMRRAAIIDPVLDFDRDRTPDSLYRTIDFSSGVSLLEWEKHRTITGWHMPR